MPVFEHQYIHYKNVLSYTAEIEESKVSDFIKNIVRHICILDFNIIGKIAFTKKGEFTEFIIPVDRSFTSTQHYRYKSEFKLVNAVKIRHFGSISEIGVKLSELNSYIEENYLMPLTSPYVIVQDIERGVFDVYVGINENIL